jgi:hypothetical protein
MSPTRNHCELLTAIGASGLVGLAAGTIQFFQAGGEGVRMWHDVFVEQVTLAEKVIRTIEDSGGQLTSSRTGWLLNIADAIRRGHSEPPRSAVFPCLHTQPMLGS